MCAITGIVSLISTYKQPSFLNPMLSSMLHRGPDSTEIEVLNKQGCFGHNRLSIIDLNERSKQPMWDATHRYCLTFNGEIYNYLDLKKELIRGGYLFRTASDAEVLIEAWAEWGVESISRLVGMFAFAVWDDHLKRLFLVRDRMGEKPLFYAPINNNFKKGLVFASELKGLLQYPFFKKTLSMTALNHYLSFNYTSTENCIFEGIYKLPPASYMMYDPNSYHHAIHEYWSLADFFNHKQMISYKDAQTKLDSLLENAIKQQSIADVPLGAFLSGGIDSTSIVAHLCQNNSSSINTYTVGFQEKSYNELAISQKTSKHFSVKHYSKILSPDISELLPKMVCAFDEPFADTSLIPTYLLCDFTRQHVTVSLSGDGGDELFGGYETYQADRYHHLLRNFPRSMKKMLIKGSHYLPASFSKVSFDYKIKKFLQGCLLDQKQAHLSWREIFNNQQKKALYRGEFTYEDAINTQLHWFNDVSDCHFLDQAMYVDIKTWLVNDILVKVDRASMAHSLEVRTPFLDHRLVEFAASLPLNYKISGSNGKRILKASQKKRIPPHVLHQPKKGFNSPISHWLSKELFEMAHDITTSHQLTQWFDKKYIETLWIEHKHGTCDNGYRLFNLLCLGLWCQSYLSC